ncbi:hypothetical protein HMPREF0577_2252 [Mobiluncus mulieris ATCC 35243]|nr:hypothetical protein HMPREF0577_2252 [Mobiluncus mulieris ATCC 35243]
MLVTAVSVSVVFVSSILVIALGGMSRQGGKWRLVKRQRFHEAPFSSPATCEGVSR